MKHYYIQPISDCLVNLGTRAVQKRMASYFVTHGSQIAIELSDAVLSEISAFNESNLPM